MAIVTFTSDFGHDDHYVAAVKAVLLSQQPGLNIVDISHSIQPFNMAHMAFVVGSVFRDFPEGSIHLLGMNVSQATEGSYLAAKIDNHYFIGPNNGVLSLLSDRPPQQVVVLDIENEITFPFKNSLPKIVSELYKGAELTKLGKETTAYVQLLLRQPRATKKEILGHVIRVDHYGNLITNIKKVDFDILSRGKQYRVVFGRESAQQVHRHYYDVEPGEVFFVFNSLNVLEIGINQGDAAMLLGLSYDSPIQIQFEE